MSVQYLEDLAADFARNWLSWWDGLDRQNIITVMVVVVMVLLLRREIAPEF